MKRYAYVTCTLFALAACAEASTGLSPDPSVSDGGALDGSVNSDGGAVAQDGNIPVGDAAVSANQLLINEISPSAEWVELVNASEAPVDLGNFTVADQLADAGAPKLAEAVHLPKGKVLSPNAYIIVHKTPKEAGACPVGSESYCFEAEFGISAKAGDQIFVLGPDDAVLSSVVLPPNAVASGKSWGRMPNASPSGAFVETAPTPGAKNEL